MIELLSSSLVDEVNSIDTGSSESLLACWLLFCFIDDSVDNDWVCWFLELTTSLASLLIVATFGALEVDNWNEYRELSDDAFFLLSVLSFYTLKWVEKAFLSKSIITLSLSQLRWLMILIELFPVEQL